MPDITKSIELKAALSSDYQAAFKAAADQARVYAGEIKQLEKQEADLRKLQALAAKQTQATADGDARAAKKAADAYNQLAAKLGFTSKNSKDLDNELKRLGDRTAKLKEQKKALDASAEANRAAQSVQRLQVAYNKLKTPELARQLADARKHAKGLGIDVGTSDAKGLRGVLGRLSGGLRDAASNFASANPIVGGLSRVFGGIPPVAAGVVGVLAGITAGAKKAREALTELAKETIASGDEIAKEARALGINAESFQELTYAMQRGGASADGFRRSIRRVAEMSDEAISGSKSAVENFKKFGISVDDLKNKNIEEVFLQMADGVAALEDPTAQMRASQELFGREGYRIVQALAVGSDELAALRKEARETGNVLSEDYLNAAEHGADVTLQFNSRIEGFKKQMGQAATAGQIRRLEALNKAFEDNKESIKTLTEIAGGFANFTDDFVVGAIEAASAALQIWDAGTKNLGDQLWKFNNETLPEFADYVGKKASDALDAMAAGLSSAGAAISGFGSDYIMPIIRELETFWLTLKNFPGWIKDLFVAGINDALQSLVDNVNEFLSWGKNVPFFGELFSGEPIKAPQIEAPDRVLSLSERVALDRAVADRDRGVVVNVTNQIDARGAAPGAGADVSRAVSSSASSAYASFEAAMDENAYISYSGRAR